MDEFGHAFVPPCTQPAPLGSGPIGAVFREPGFVSPLAVLGRGYSLTLGASDGRIVRDAAELAAGDRLVTRLARGRVTSRVERVEP